MKTNLISRVRRAVVPVSTPCRVCVAPAINIMMSMMMMMMMLMVVHLPSFHDEGNGGYGTNNDDDDGGKLTNEKASQLSFRSCPDIAHCSGSPRTQKSSSPGLKRISISHCHHHHHHHYHDNHHHCHHQHNHQHTYECSISTLGLMAPCERESSLLACINASLPICCKPIVLRNMMIMMMIVKTKVMLPI